MSKVKRKELVEKANDHELRIFRIEKALKQHGINWFVEEPKLKQLDQSVFAGLDAKWRFAAVDKIGAANGFNKRVEPIDDMFDRFVGDDDPVEIFYIGTGYDTSNWQNSLIERDKVELTGSDLCRAMLERGDKFVMCKVWNKNYGDINQFVDVVLGYRTDLDKFTSVEGNLTDFANPINPRTGEPLTQSEAGL